MIWNVWHAHSLLGIVNTPTIESARTAARERWGIAKTLRGRVQRTLSVEPAATQPRPER